ncbi:MAG TPA: hypothetical protein PKC28_12350, partial [Bdellovibrionales bacterium]|nr:hypothetical protein [Bdellovibrionales bacterium]
MRHRFQVRMALVLGLLFSCAAGASFSGSFRSSTDYYPEHLGAQTDDLVPYLVLDLNGKHRLRKNLRFQWRLYGLANLESESEPEQYYGDISEGFLEWKLSDLRWRLGVNTLNWGIVDVSSPMDVVNTPAFFHPTRIHKQGAPMVELDWKPERLGVHGIYIPKQRRAELPSTDSRWLPRSFLTNPGNAEGTVVLPDFIEYRFGEPETLSKALDNNWGIRLTSNLGSFDFALMHFEGAAPSPKVRPTIVADAGSTPTEVVARSSIDLQVVSYRVRTSGFGFAWAGDNLIVRVESAYQHTI